MFRYEEPYIVFYKNVNPPGFLPLWDIEYKAKDFTEIKDIEKYSEDEITSMIYFFEDMQENYQSSPEDFDKKGD